MNRETVYCKALKIEVNKLVKCPEYTCEQCPEIKPKVNPISSKPNKSETKKPKAKISNGGHRRLTKFDRVLSTVRHPEYQHDYGKLSMIKNKEKAKEFEKELGKKWNIYPIPPLELFPPYKKPEHCEHYPAFTEEDDVIVVTDVSPEHPPLKFESKINHAELIEAVHRDLFKKGYKKLSPREINSALEAMQQAKTIKGKYLYLRVDITGKNLKAKFESIIKQYKSYLPKDNSRNKDMTYSPWSIYNLKHYGGMNLLQITKKLTGKRGNPTYNKKLMKEYQAIRLAYDKAIEMIKQVGEEAIASHPPSKILS